jgi:hypothetical protein
MPVMLYFKYNITGIHSAVIRWNHGLSLAVGGFTNLISPKLRWSAKTMWDMVRTPLGSQGEVLRYPDPGWVNQEPPPRLWMCASTRLACATQETACGLPPTLTLSLMERGFAPRIGDIGWLTDTKHDLLQRDVPPSPRGEGRGEGSVPVRSSQRAQEVTDKCGSVGRSRYWRR